MLIRPWTLQDLPAVRDVIWKTWLATYRAFIPEEDLEEHFALRYSADALAALFHQPGVEGFVAEVGGRIGGEEIDKLSAEEQRYYVSSLYVLPECQGYHLGSLLLRRAEARALAHGMDRIWLGVMTRNEPSVAWYKKRGFVFVEEQPFTMGRTTVQHLIGYKEVKQTE